jgi:hypothetical protein
MKVYGSPMSTGNDIPPSVPTTCRRRRRRICHASAGPIVPLLCILSVASIWWTADAAFHSGAVPPMSLARTRSRQSAGAAPFSSNIVVRSRIQTARSADTDENNNNNSSPEIATWSQPATRSGSPLQVRNRVKAVLEKARSRTGIENTSTQNPSSVIADAASLGGLGDGSVDFILQLADMTSPNRKNGSESLKQKSPELDAIQADVPAAATFCEPLPFVLPKLTPEQVKQLEAGERVQEQARMGREGSGYVVLDVKAPPYVVWECLLDFESYPELIPTVREMQLFTNRKLNTGYVNEKPVLPGTGRETRHYGTPSVTRASFTLSKFRLNIAAIHKYTPHPEGDYMIFTLDPSCTNMVLKGAKGTWYTKANPEGREVREVRQKRHSSHPRLIGCQGSRSFSSFCFWPGIRFCLSSGSQLSCAVRPRRFTYPCTHPIALYCCNSGLDPSLLVVRSPNIKGTTYVHCGLCR